MQHWPWCHPRERQLSAVPANCEASLVVRNHSARRVRASTSDAGVLRIAASTIHNGLRQLLSGAKIAAMARFRGPRTLRDFSRRAENLFPTTATGACMCSAVSSPGSYSVRRIALTILSGLFDWRGALIVVCPEALLSWHRQGWNLLAENWLASQRLLVRLER
jgi:hypothetical protein